MTTTYLTSQMMTFRATSATVNEFVRRCATYDAQQEKSGYTGRANFTRCGDTVTFEVGSACVVYHGDNSAFADFWRVEMDRWMSSRVWMNTESKSYRKLAFVYKGNLMNCVGHIGWCPGAKRTVGVTYACFGADGHNKLAEFPTMAKAKAFMLGLAAQHPSDMKAA